MEVNKHRLMHVCWMFVMFLISLAVCMLDKSGLKTHPCDIDQDYINKTVKFECQRRKLSTMPNFFDNTTSIDASENEIKNLTVDSLKGLSKLKYLNLTQMSHNVSIAEGVFANLTNLEKLRLNRLSLKEIPEQLPRSLIELRLDENKIVSLSPRNFLQLTNLTHLYLSKNCYYGQRCFKFFEIANGTFSSLDKLLHLSLSYDNLSHVPRDLPVSLVTLELASNMISFIGEDDFKQLKNLKTLKIQGNCPRCHNAPYPCVPCANGSINIHERAFDHLRKLEILHLAGNSLSVVKNAWFENISQLQELYLSFNFLAQQIAEGTFLSNLKLLMKLDLSFNYDLQAYPETVRLAPSFADLYSLRILHIQGLVFRKIQNDTLAPLYGLRNLTTLDLGINFIVAVAPGIFNHFHNLRLLYLSENRLYPVTSSEQRKPGNNIKPPHFNLPDLSHSNFARELEPYGPISRLAKPECSATGHVLDLSRNNLFFISPKQFEGYRNISCLNLSRNGFASALNGTEFSTLPNLKYLDLSYNKIDLAYDYAFVELKELEVLDLSYNAHYFIVPGVTHNLNFLKNLPKLRVLNMSSNSIFTLTTKYMCSNSLAELQFQGNQLGKLWAGKDLYVKLFWNLTNLTHLDISANNIRKIPTIVYKYLPVTLKRFELNSNALTNLNWTLMMAFTQLEELSLGYNHFTTVSSVITKNIPSLRYLDLSHNRISQLVKGFLSGTVNLEMLDLSYNKLSTIDPSNFSSENRQSLKTLWLHDNPYHCTCEMDEFVDWLGKREVKIPKLIPYVQCSTPHATKGQTVISFNFTSCNDQIPFRLYCSSTLLVVGITFVTTLMHLFYWDFSYVFYYMKAKVKGYQHLSSGHNVYDAFVTYDTKDPQVSEWVLNHLRVQLEDEGDHFLPVCLEERDWLPGCPILDSLTQSIRQSRKTIFVLTHSYVKSGSFKMAMYLAHQRLLDESEDVIVLLLLEPVLQNSHFLRLRKRLCSRCVLEWPQTPAAEPWFWQCLRNAVRVENNVMYSNIYSRYFTIKTRPGKKE